MWVTLLLFSPKNSLKPFDGQTLRYIHISFKGWAPGKGKRRGRRGRKGGGWLPLIFKTCLNPCPILT